MHQVVVMLKVEPSPRSEVDLCSSFSSRICLYMAVLVLPLILTNPNCQIVPALKRNLNTMQAPPCVPLDMCLEFSSFYFCLIRPESSSSCSLSHWSACYMLFTQEWCLASHSTIMDEVFSRWLFFQQVFPSLQRITDAVIEYPPFWPRPS